MRSLYLGNLCVIVISVCCTFLMGVYASFMDLDFSAGKTTVAQMGVAPLLVASFGLWVLAMWRNEFLADWLSDQRLREQAAELARQLSSAQIQPQLSGGEVLLKADVLADGSLQAEVIDDGPGLAQELEFSAATQAQPTGAAGDHGLRNSSLRLAQVLVRPGAAADPAAR